MRLFSIAGMTKMCRTAVDFYKFIFLRTSIFKMSAIKVQNCIKCTHKSANNYCFYHRVGLCSRRAVHLYNIVMNTTTAYKLGFPKRRKGAVKFL